MTRSDSEGLGMTRGDPMRLGMTQSNLACRVVRRSDGTMRSESELWEETLSDADLSVVRVTYPDSLPAGHIHPDMSGTPGMQRYPPIAHRRVPARVPDQHDRYHIPQESNETSSP